MSSNIVTVYVAVLDTVNSVSQTDVIQGGMYIYATDDPTDSTPAAAGTYGDNGTGNFTEFQQLGGPDFALGRRGRVWFANNLGEYNWDTTTTDNQNVEYITFEFNDIPGLFVCQYDGLGDIDDGAGFTDENADTDPDVDTPGSEEPDPKPFNRQ